MAWVMLGATHVHVRRTPPLSVVVLTFFFVAPLCSGCSSSPTAPSAPIVLSATTVTFPTTAVGDTTTSTVTLTTTSDQIIGLADSDTADFPYSTTCTVSMPSGSTCVITLKFHPSAAGNLQAFFSVNSASGKPLSITLTGTAVGAGPPFNAGSPGRLQIITTEPDPFYLSSGQTAQLSAFSTSNDGGAVDVSTSAAWTSSDPTVATVSPAGLVTALAGGTASITVVYLGQTAFVRVLVVGTIVVTPTAYLFPATTLGQNSISQPFTVTFNGGPNEIGSISSSDPSEFYVEHTNCDETSGHTSGYVCTLTIGFSPAAPGPRTAQIAIASAPSTGSAPATITLTGLGQ